MNRLLSRAASFALVGAFLIVGGTGCASKTDPGLLSDDASSSSMSLASDEERDAVLARWPEADIPVVTAERVVSTTAEWQSAVVSCVRAAGFEASALEDGGVSYEFPPEGQEQALAIAQYVCFAKYPLELNVEPFTDSDLRRLYDYYVSSLLPCLEQAGFEVDAAPGVESFLDSYEFDPWLPYSAVQSQSAEQWTAINRSCPQYPEDLVEAHQ